MQTDGNMQVIGICRFSYPGLGGFQVEHANLEERMAFLYAPDRMEARFRMFETITLPGLRAQTDPDFTLLIVIGESLPDHYLERLMALVGDLPQAVVQRHPPGRHRAVMQEAINSLRRFDGRPCLQFRMDDDDAVAITFVEQLRAATLDLYARLGKHRHIAIDFDRGYIARPGPDGICAAPTRVPFTTAALALMFAPTVRLSVMNFAHNKLAGQMPTLTISDTDMFVRGHNDHNDSRQRPGVRPVPLTPLDAKGEAHFRQVFDIDAEHVRQVFSAP